MSKLNFNINISWSKIMSLLILLIGSAYSFYTKESAVILVAIPTSASGIAIKQYLLTKKTI